MRHGIADTTASGVAGARVVAKTSVVAAIRGQSRQASGEHPRHMAQAGPADQTGKETTMQSPKRPKDCFEGMPRPTAQKGSVPPTRNRWYQLCHTAPVICLLTASGAIANPDERLRHFLSLSLEELMEQKVTISTQTARSLSNAPSAVSVITAEDIKATGATNLVDVLQGVPGIYIRYSQFGFRPLISFRGANDKQTLVMVNGAPMSDLMWRLGIFWKGLPASVIDRVEIIRGPGSALFGTDASAGVINVITKTAGGISENEAGVRVGSFNTLNGWLQYGGQWNGLDVAVTADLARTDGHGPLIDSDAQSRSDLAFGTTASLAPGDAGYGWQNTDLRFSLSNANWRLLADYTRHDNLATGLTGAGALDPITEGTDNRLDIGLLYDNEQFSADWGVNAELRYRYIDYTSGDGFQEWPPGHSDASGNYPAGVINQMTSAEQRLSAEAGGIYHGIDDHAIRVGAGYVWQDLYHVEQWVNSGVGGNGIALPAGGPPVDISDTPYAFAPEKTRHNIYVYLQDEWAIARDWELTVGARYDHYSDFAGSLTPRLALVWQTSDQLTTKLLYGQAFRAPYYQELYAETSFSLPNPDLDPERSETWELALSFTPHDELYLGMNLFRFEQRDVISLQPVAGQSKLQYQNAGEHRIHGLELEGRWQAAQSLRLAANFTLNDPDSSRYREIGLPRQQAYLRADWQFLPGWHWNVQTNWIGERDRSAGDLRAPVDDHLITDSTLRYAGIRHWEFALSVRNLFDVDAREFMRSSIPNDLPLPGRSIYAEARYLLDN